jgi:hypothetical protein
MRLFLISASFAMLIAKTTRDDDRGLTVFAAGSLRQATLARSGFVPIGLPKANR